MKTVYIYEDAFINQHYIVARESLVPRGTDYCTRKMADKTYLYYKKIFKKYENIQDILEMLYRRGSNA